MLASFPHDIGIDSMKEAQKFYSRRNYSIKAQGDGESLSKADLLEDTRSIVKHHIPNLRIL